MRQPFQLICYKPIRLKRNKYNIHFLEEVLAMLLFGTTLIKHPLIFKPLSQCMEHLTLAASWAEGEWGYIRNKGLEFRKDIFSSLQNDVYVGTWNDKPVALFAIFPKNMDPEFQDKKFRGPAVSELMYVYVDKPYRGLGFGKQIMEEAKKIAQGQQAEFIMLDTLKPALNRFYKNAHAEVIAENQLYSHPTDVLTIKLS